MDSHEGIIVRMIMGKMDYKNFLAEHQASTLKLVLQGALKYHFENFTALEKLGDPYSVRDGTPINDIAIRMQANTRIKFEVMAYLMQLRRLKHFIKFLISKYNFAPPSEPPLLKVWNDLMDTDGTVNVLANKWVAHRSVDDPKGESDDFHLAVLFNLESTITFWDNGHMFLAIRKYEFYLFHYHPQVIAFVEWVFVAVEKLQPSPNADLLQDAAKLDQKSKTLN